MTRMRFSWLGAMALVALGGAALALPNRNQSATAITAVDPGAVRFRPAPIREDWLIGGHPTAMAAEVAHTADDSTHVYIWKTTAGRFHWYYQADELVTVLDGDVFISEGTGPERHLGPGAIAFFPAGAATIWRVPDHLRKVATLRRPLPGPIARVVAAIRTVKHWLHPANPAFALE